MAKKSTLRVQDYPHVAEDANGKRLPYDPDRVPEGMDSRIWQLALYFEQKMEEIGHSAKGRPIIYVSLSRRLDKTGLDVLRAHARNCGISNWVTLLERMIDEYFSSSIHTPSIDNFTEYENFKYFLQYTADGIQREELIRTGKLVPQPDLPVQASKRTPEQQKHHEILDRKYTEEEQLEKMKDFRSRNK